MEPRWDYIEAVQREWIPRNIGAPSTDIDTACLPAKKNTEPTETGDTDLLTDLLGPGATDVAKSLPLSGRDFNSSISITPLNPPGPVHPPHFPPTISHEHDLAFLVGLLLLLMAFGIQRTFSPWHCIGSSSSGYEQVSAEAEPEVEVQAQAEQTQTEGDSKSGDRGWRNEYQGGGVQMTGAGTGYQNA